MKIRLPWVKNISHRFTRINADQIRVHPVTISGLTS